MSAEVEHKSAHVPKGALERSYLDPSKSREITETERRVQLGWNKAVPQPSSDDVKHLPAIEHRKRMDADDRKMNSAPLYHTPASQLAQGITANYPPDTNEKTNERDEPLMSDPLEKTSDMGVTDDFDPNNERGMEVEEDSEEEREAREGGDYGDVPDKDKDAIRKEDIRFREALEDGVLNRGESEIEQTDIQQETLDREEAQTQKERMEDSEAFHQERKRKRMQEDADTTANKRRPSLTTLDHERARLTCAGELSNALKISEEFKSEECTKKGTQIEQAMYDACDGVSQSYKQHFRELIPNLRHNGELRHSVLRGDTTPQHLLEMDYKDLAPTNLNRSRQQSLQDDILDRVLPEPVEQKVLVKTMHDIEVRELQHAHLRRDGDDEVSAQDTNDQLERLGDEIELSKPLSMTSQRKLRADEIRAESVSVPAGPSDVHSTALTAELIKGRSAHDHPILKLHRPEFSEVNDDKLGNEIYKAADLQTKHEKMHV